MALPAISDPVTFVPANAAYAPNDIASPVVAFAKRATPNTSVTARAARPTTSPVFSPATRSSRKPVMSDFDDVFADDFPVLDRGHAEVRRDVTKLIEIECGRCALVVDFAGLQGCFAFSKGGNCHPRRIGNLADPGVDGRGVGLARRLDGERKNDDHVPSHCRIGVAQARRVHRLLISGVIRLEGVRPFVGDGLHGDDPFRHLRSDRLDEIGICGPAGNDPLLGISGLVPFTKNDRRVGDIGTGDDHIGLGGEDLLQFGTVTGLVRFVDDRLDDLSTFLFPRLAESFGIADAGSVVESHRGRPLEPFLFRDFSEGSPEAIVGGLKAVRKSFGVRWRHGQRRRARGIHEEQVRVAGKRQRRQRFAGRPDAEQRLDLVDLDELFHRENGGLRLGLRVLGRDLEFEACRPACCVDRLDARLKHFLRAGPIGGTGAGNAVRGAYSEDSGALREAGSVAGHRCDQLAAIDGHERFPVIMVSFSFQLVKWFFTTAPAFMIRGMCAPRLVSSERSLSGSPSTTTRSAKAPAARVPICPSIRQSLAATVVAEAMTSWADSTRPRMTNSSDWWRCISPSRSEP